MTPDDDEFGFILESMITMPLKGIVYPPSIYSLFNKNSYKENNSIVSILDGQPADYNPAVKYGHTNESLDAVVNGLEVQPSDDIIGVCGSGDQAFAMLENAKSVVVVDNNEYQVDYAKERASMLKAGDIESFLNLGAKKYGNKITDGNDVRLYFSQPGRLERIRANIGNLEIKYAKDFLDEMKEGRFSKAYLSNILGYYGFMENKEEREAYIEKIMARLREPGLVYITNGATAFVSCPPGIENADELTAIARAEEKEKGLLKWSPAVLRRAA